MHKRSKILNTELIGRGPYLADKDGLEAKPYLVLGWGGVGGVGGVSIEPSADHSENSRLYGFLVKIYVNIILGM